MLRKGNHLQWLLALRYTREELPINLVNINMVYDTKTLVVLHQLTPDGEERYKRFLEDEGTRILYRA